jgi:hypothetical protein
MSRKSVTLQSWQIFKKRPSLFETQIVLNLQFENAKGAFVLSEKFILKN